MKTQNLSSIPCLVFVGIFCLLSGVAQADIIFSNPLIGSNLAAGAGAYTTDQTVGSNVSAEGIDHVGVDASGGQDYSTKGWNNNALDLGRYITLKFSANSGFAINLTDLVYGSRTNQQGPKSFAIRSSVDGFASDIATPGSGGGTIALSGSSFQGLTGDVEFRIYAWDGGNANGQFDITNFTFNGTVSAVPEPAAATLLGLCAVASVFRRKRHL